MLTTSPNTSSNNEFPTSRRVSFDLSHNKIHVLPTLEECRDAAKQRSREEWQRRTLNEDMLSEDIIIEIQEDCSGSSRSDDDEKEVTEKPVIEIKSCLKKPPVVVASVPKKNHGKKNQKKRKRSYSKSSHVDVSNAISVH